MANPRQRRKSRSGSHKAVRHSNNAKKNLKKQPPIRGPKVLQDAWDKHKTVRQNYEALGLLPTLNPNASGGVEHRPEHSMDAPTAPEASGTQKEATSNPIIPKGFGRIVRDADGNIVDVEMGEEDEAEDESEPAFPEDVDLSKEEALTPWVSLGSASKAGSTGSKETHVVQSLEAISQSDVPVVRHSSNGESKLLRNLITKYGEDVDAMARDRKMNAAQRTAGELKRAIKKAGGFQALRT
ncbi:hypothetical protein EIP91_008101 [Steccherinum ochraceum]|uniref:Nucleolar protein 16 n=1 Tax=Steccherinum ochraceum TaxID=92696 RepID=A0A4R0RBJ7_9APHY|nr:hypothetical protein EIP91_008101 [Steccherinum ochraceum]